jgi:ribonuclease-3
VISDVDGRIGRIGRIESILGHRFADRGLCEQAITHRSFAFETTPPRADNERLEMLGDALVGFAVAESLFALYPDADEGTLTRQRAGLVSQDSLAAVMEETGLSGLLLVGRAESRAVPASIAASALEALVAAVLIDAGIDAARSVVTRLLGGREESDCSHQDPKGQLQQRIQRVFRRHPDYAVTRREGPDHAPTFQASVTVAGLFLAAGQGGSHREATRVAAASALVALANTSDDELLARAPAART